MQWVIPSLAGLVWTSAIVAADTNITGLLSIPPSLYWDGVDGSWSTFFVQVGTPAQAVRLLPGTSANAGNSIWVVISPGCATLNPTITDCATERGSLFASNESTSWNTQRLANGGLFTLGDYEEKFLGLTGNAYYGFDTVELGVPGAGLPTTPNQLIAGFATNDFWLGSLGISPISSNFTNFNDPVPSLITTLRQQGQIGGTSWGYTAGAQYQNPPVFGSLTLGGYDEARFNSSTALRAVPFGADFSRDLLIGIQAITYNTLGASPLLSRGIYAFIDSMVSQMWLPLNVCQQFEQAFNLTWNATAELYLLSDVQHQNLLNQNPTITFVLSASADSSSNTQVTEIQFPYSAFDLNISAPYVQGSNRYFPLKRAQNETQYTLGRVFLQEAYVIADYDRQQFQIGQALFPGSGETDLKTISPPGASNGTSGNSTSATPQNQGQNHQALRIGAIAGIAVGAVVLLLALVLALVWYRRRLTHQRKAAAEQEEHAQRPISSEKRLSRIHVSPIYEADTLAANRHEMSDHDARKHEMDGYATRRHELTGQEKEYFSELSSEQKLAEMEGNTRRARNVFISELEGSMPALAELSTSPTARRGAGFLSESKR